MNRARRLRVPLQRPQRREPLEARENGVLARSEDLARGFMVVQILALHRVLDAVETLALGSDGAGQRLSRETEDGDIAGDGGVEESGESCYQEGEKVAEHFRFFSLLILIVFGLKKVECFFP